ncbi:CXXC motif containing zinc binding protein-like isoform X2 [Clytia hemisphaerica]|uniref:CXXC motif containing zinc binding protein n=1 Tax=Clytia hemisphaerica TaxID=252671 RepID=A0A7M5X1P9_9CNID
MVKIGLQIKAQLEFLTDLKPESEDFRWYIKVKCLNCGEESKSFIYLTLLESNALKGGRGQASMVSKCKLCSRENSIDILKDTISSYTFEDSESFKTVVAFECRGMEPIEFSPRAGWVAKGAETTSSFTVDLTEGDWCDFDERSGESVGIYEIEHKFQKC